MGYSWALVGKTIRGENNESDKDQDLEKREEEHATITTFRVKKKSIGFFRGWDAAGPPFLQCFWAFSNVLYEYLGMVIWGHPTHE